MKTLKISGIKLEDAPDVALQPPPSPRKGGQPQSADSELYLGLLRNEEHKHDPVESPPVALSFPAPQVAPVPVTPPSPPEPSPLPEPERAAGGAETPKLQLNHQFQRIISSIEKQERKDQRALERSSRSSRDLRSGRSRGSRASSVRSTRSWGTPRGSVHDQPPRPPSPPEAPAPPALEDLLRKDGHVKNMRIDIPQTPPRPAAPPTPPPDPGLVRREILDKFSLLHSKYPHKDIKINQNWDNGRLSKEYELTSRRFRAELSVENYEKMLYVLFGIIEASGKFIKLDTEGYTEWQKATSFLYREVLADLAEEQTKSAEKQSPTRRLVTLVAVSTVAFVCAKLALRNVATGPGALLAMMGAKAPQNGNKDPSSLLQGSAFSGVLSGLMGMLGKQSPPKPPPQRASPEAPPVKRPPRKSGMKGPSREMLEKTTKQVRG